MSIVIYILLVLSVFINVLMYWYIRQLLGQFRLGANNGNIVAKAIENYQNHLQSVYELESYYGDTTIGGLLQHTSDLLEEVKNYQEYFFQEIEQEKETTDE